MKILQLTNKVPYPPSDGGVIAVLSLAVGLADLGHDVTTLSMKTLKHNFNVKDIPSEFSDKINFLSINVPAKISTQGLFQNFFFSDKPYTATRFISEDYSLKLIDLFKENKYDIIQLEGLYLAPYIDLIKQYSKAPIVMRAHNLEYEIWERVKKNTSNKIKKVYLRNLTKKLRKFELSYLNDYDLLLPITKRDGEQFRKLGYKNALHTLVTGIDADRYTFDLNKTVYPTLFHLGSLDWEPNLEGLRWFLTKIWPSILSKYPNQKFHIAGRNASPETIKYLKSFNNIIFDGEVGSANEYINSKAIMLVPLLSGSGMRIKILEGMALSKAIVATKIGVEGIDAKDEKEILIANEHNEFIKKTLQLIEDKQFYEKVSSNARTFIKKEFDNKTIVKALIKEYENLINKS
jgi:glycosyltransferase involved in cell wall biosynthesis